MDEQADGITVCEIQNHVKFHVMGGEQREGREDSARQEERLPERGNCTQSLRNAGHKDSSSLAGLANSREVSEVTVFQATDTSVVLRIRSTVDGSVDLLG